MTGLDHILWAAPDLGAGEKIIESLTGVAPARGGSHPGLGTRNSLMGLNSGIYLEIISPDPAQELEGNRGGRIAALPRPGIMTFAIRSDDLDTLSAAARREGLSLQGPVAMSRDRPDGVRLDWTILYLEDSRFGEAIPFVIDWGAIAASVRERSGWLPAALLRRPPSEGRRTRASLRRPRHSDPCQARRLSRFRRGARDAKWRRRPHPFLKPRASDAKRNVHAVR